MADFQVQIYTKSRKQEIFKHVFARKQDFFKTKYARKQDFQAIATHKKVHHLSNNNEKPLVAAPTLERK